MKILSVVHSLSYPPESGAVRRTFHLLDESVRRHNVTILAFGTAEREKRIHDYFGDRCDDIVFVDRSRTKLQTILTLARVLLNGRGLLAESVTPAMQTALDAILQNGPFDMITVSSPVLLYYSYPPGIPIVADTQNVEYELFERLSREGPNPVWRAYYALQHVIARKEEIRLLRLADAIQTPSARDLSIFRRDINNCPMFVVPNGVDLSYFKPMDVAPEPMTMVFTGIMNYAPNSSGIIHFLDEIFPRILTKVPGAKVYVVGSNPARALIARATANIIVTGYVEDIRPYVANAQVFVIPLLAGGGTRLKALEAMAMKRPIVSTSVGIEGIDVTDGESSLIADDPAEFSSAVIRLFDDELLRNKLTDGASRVARRYDWVEIGRTQESVHESFAARIESGLEMSQEGSVC
jgi:glycosyltransferase involved in cell wall biosynthesis